MGYRQRTFKSDFHLDERLNLEHLFRRGEYCEHILRYIEANNTGSVIIFGLSNRGILYANALSNGIELNSRATSCISMPFALYENRQNGDTTYTIKGPTKDHLKKEEGDDRDKCIIFLDENTDGYRGDDEGGMKVDLHVAKRVVAYADSDDVEKGFKPLFLRAKPFKVLRPFDIFEADYTVGWPRLRLDDLGHKASYFGRSKEEHVIGTLFGNNRPEKGYSIISGRKNEDDNFRGLGLSLRLKPEGGIGIFIRGEDVLRSGFDDGRLSRKKVIIVGKDEDLIEKIKTLKQKGLADDFLVLD